MVTMLIGIANILLSVLGTLVLIHVVLSLLINFNVVNLHNELVRGIYTGLEALLNPIYRPFRKIVPNMGGIDWAPLSAAHHHPDSARPGLGFLRLPHIVLSRAVAQPWRISGAHLLLAVRVTPRSSREIVEGIWHDADGGAWLSVKVRAAPDDGQANKAVIALLAKTLGLAQICHHFGKWCRCPVEAAATCMYDIRN
jgi:YggT family protein